MRKDGKEKKINEREGAERLLYLCVYGTSSFFLEVVSFKIRCIGFITEGVRGFLYPKYFVRTCIGCTKIGTFFFMLWCDDRKKMKV